MSKITTEEINEIETTRISGGKRRLSERIAQCNQQMDGGVSSIRVANNQDPNTTENWGPYYIIPVASMSQAASLFPIKSKLEKSNDISNQIRSDMIRNERSVGASLYNTYVKNRAINDKIVDAEYSSTKLINDANSKVAATKKKRRSKKDKLLEETTLPPTNTVVDLQKEYNKAVNNVNRRQKKNRKRFRLFVMVSNANYYYYYHMILLT